MVSLVVKSSRTPKLVNVVPDQAGVIQPNSRRSRETRMYPTTNEEPSTLELINEAQEAGLSVDQLVRAKRALHSCNNPCSVDIRLSKHIVSMFVYR